MIMYQKTNDKEKEREKAKKDEPPQKEKKDKFVDRMHRWQQMHRDAWRWPQRPKHRDTTVGAYEHTDRMQRMAAQDAVSLKGERNMNLGQT